jgi:hypothetical protein
MALTAIIAFWIGINIRNFFPVATVNGKPIKRDIFASRVIRSSSVPILNELIIQELVFQEADKRKINLTKKEVADYKKQIEKQLKEQGILLNQAIMAQGKTEKDFDRELRAQLLAERMFGKNISVTDRDVENYFAQNKIAKGSGAILESQILSIKKIISQQKLREQFAKWLELQRKTAKIKVLLNF